MSSVSIIIPTYNGLSLLHKHLPSVLMSLRKHDELIIVDDAGTDDSVAWLRSEYKLKPEENTHIDMFCYSGTYKDIEIKVLVNRTNQRFASSCNRGVESAKSDIVILLNNDVSPEKDFLSYLTPHFDDEHVFGVSCKEISSVDGKEYGRAVAHFKRGFYVHSRASDQVSGETAWVIGGSGAFRKSMWKILGGFDLDFKPAYGEDIDLSFRAQMKGWKTLYEERSIVHHVHESTNADVFGQKRIEIMSYKNAFLFMWKNTRGLTLLLHFLWLPYHFVFTAFRSRGRFLRGFFHALHDYFT